jgi:hypothetical protein
LAVVRLLLADPRVDPTALGNEAFHVARRGGGHLAVCVALLQHPSMQPPFKDELPALLFQSQPEEPEAMATCSS